MTDQVCRNFCVNTATGRPFLYFGISNGRNCYCGNTPPQTVAGLPNASLCTTPNSGDPSQAGGGPNAINVWLASPVAVGSSSGLPGGLPSGASSVSLPGGLPMSSGLPSVTLPGGLPSGSGLPSVSLPISLPSGITSIPGGGLPSNVPGAGDLSSLLSVIGGIPSSLLPSGFSIPVLPSVTPGASVPGGELPLSSLLSVIGGIPSSLLPSGFSVPVLPSVTPGASIPGGGLPSGVPGAGDLSSLLSVIGGIPSSLLPSGFSIPVLPSVTPGASVPGGELPLSSLLSVIGGIPSSLLPSGFSVPVLPSVTPGASIPGGVIPSNVPGAGDLSSLLSVIGGIPSSLLPPGFSVPVSVPASGLPGGVSSLLSVIGGLPSSVVPSGLPGAISSIIGGGIPSVSIPGGLPGQVSVTSAPTVTSSPIVAAPTTQGIPLPAVTVVADPSKLIGTADPAGRFLGCLASTGLNGLPIFNGPALFSTAITQASCNIFCNAQPGGPFRFYAIEQGNLCHCGQSIDTANVISDTTGCNMAAQGDPLQIQNGGGRGRLATFQNLVFPADPVCPRFLITIMCSKLALHKTFSFHAKVGIG
jgi:hypothetical protein